MADTFQSIQYDNIDLDLSMEAYKAYKEKTALP